MIWLLMISFTAPLGPLAFLVSVFYFLQKMTSLSSGPLFMADLTYSFSSSTLNLSLTLLVIWVGILCMFTPSSLTSQLFLKLLFSLILILDLTFNSDNLLLFYFLFEMSLLPIFVIVLGWGYQPERLNAGLSLLFYTVIASLPLLLCMILYADIFHVLYFSFLENFFWKISLKSSLSSLILKFSLLASFSVKLPMYYVHLWLPKAHVEAPVVGSMILAAILLKLGGYGILRISPLISCNSVSPSLFIYFSILGGSLISFLCLRQTDIKVIIAYSSVAHMSLVVSAALCMSAYAYAGCVVLMIAHGSTSSGMFAAANMMYERWGTRNVLLSKSLSNLIPVFSMWWFLLCVCNMGAPPSVNLVSEILCLISLISFNLVLLPVMSLLTMLAVVFTLLLYSSSQQGNLSKNKTSSFNLTPQESLIVSSHVSLTFLLALIFNLMI